jgi:hypothetical protein
VELRGPPSAALAVAVSVVTSAGSGASGAGAPSSASGGRLSQPSCSTTVQGRATWR